MKEDVTMSKTPYILYEIILAHQNISINTNYSKMSFIFYLS